MHVCTYMAWKKTAGAALAWMSVFASPSCFSSASLLPTGGSLALTPAGMPRRGAAMWAPGLVDGTADDGWGAGDGATLAMTGDSGNDGRLWQWATLAMDGRLWQ